MSILQNTGYNTVDHFLQTAKNSLWNILEYEKVTVVMGNEACDLDTIACSLVYSIYFYDMYKRYSMDSVAIALFDMLPEELILKTEVLYWLKKLKISTTHFMFRNDIDLKQIHDAGKLELILVDHHVLAPRWKDLESSVIEVIDHRPVQKLWPQAKVNISIVGSCSSLIAGILIEKRKDIFSLQVSALLYGAIVLDTAGLSATSGRTTEQDITTAVMFESMYPQCSRESVLNELVKARADISSLPTNLVLIKDMKMACGIPICGFPVSIPKLMERSDFNEALSTFCKNRKFQIIVLMGQEVLSGNFKRDLGIFTDVPEWIGGLKLAEFLLQSKNPDLLLEEVKQDKTPGLHLYKQENAHASRKQVLPLVLEAITKVTELQVVSEYPCRC